MMADKRSVKKEQINPFINIDQLKSFNDGTNFKSYNFLGAHKAEIFGEAGFSFALWAPNAVNVSVVGDFNGWDINENNMNPQGSSGVWHAFVKGAKEGQRYKYYITAKSGEGIYKADPYGYYAQVRPETASVLYDIEGYEWAECLFCGKVGLEY